MRFLRKRAYDRRSSKKPLRPSEYRWRTDFNMRRLMNMIILKSRGVVIVSYPRSGRTWLFLMLHELSIGPRFSHGGQKRLHLGKPEPVCNITPDYQKNRVLFMLRDPRDLIVSHYHARVRKGKWNGDLASFVRDPFYGIERILAFNLGWLRARDQFNDFATLRYEDLRRNTEAELVRIIGFLGCRIPKPKAVASAVAGLAFERMRQREQSGELYARYGPIFSAGSESDNGMAIRRGVIGSHVEEMAAADREFCEELLQRYDYFATVNRLIGGQAA